jgi:hypothetical protein
VRVAWVEWRGLVEWGVVFGCEGNAGSVLVGRGGEKLEESSVVIKAGE